MPTWEFGKLGGSTTTTLFGSIPTSRQSGISPPQCLNKVLSFFLPLPLPFYLRKEISFTSHLCAERRGGMERGGPDWYRNRRSGGGGRGEKDISRQQKAGGEDHVFSPIERMEDRGGSSGICSPALLSPQDFLAYAGNKYRVAASPTTINSDKSDLHEVQENKVPQHNWAGAASTTTTPSASSAGGGIALP